MCLHAALVLISRSTRSDRSALCSIDDLMRDERDLDCGRPRSSGLSEVMRRRVRRSLGRSGLEERESMEADRLRRLAGALPRRREDMRALCLWREGAGEREGERVVEIVDTESADEEDGDRERRRAASFWLSRASARPVRRTSASGMWVVSLGCS